MDLLKDYLVRAFPQHQKFAEEACQKPLALYVREKKVAKNFGSVKEKSIITAIVPTTSVNIATGKVAEESVCFQQDGIIVINKPADLATQPVLKAADDNLYHQLIYTELLQKKLPAKMPYIGLHHRLDRDTSGLVIFTTRPSQNKRVADWFQNRRLTKSYLVLVKGQVKESSWTVTKNIKRQIHDKHKFYFTATDFGGNKAKTEFKALHSLSEELHLLEASPITGRTHQIRVHVKSCGLKIIGDRLYGVDPKNTPMRLHAWKLELPWGKEKKVISRLPDWPELKDTEILRFAQEDTP